MINKGENETLDELSVLCIEKQALIQAALETLAMVCCGGEEEHDQVSTALLLSYTCVVAIFDCFAIVYDGQISEVLVHINSILNDPDFGGGPLGHHGQVLVFHLLETCQSKRQLMDMLLHRFNDLCRDIECLRPINMMLQNAEVSYFNLL